MSKNFVKSTLFFKVSKISLLNDDGYAKNKGVVVGANVESISTRKVEIEASIKLLKDIKRSIDRKV